MIENFKCKCPYKFHRMFPKNTKETDELKDMLVFEVFTVRKDADFAKFLEEDIKVHNAFSSAILPRPDVEYEKAWENIEGRDESRLLLYPKHDKLNRLFDPDNADDNSDSDWKKYSKSEYSDMGYILTKIDELGDDSDIEYEEHKIRGFEQATYMYNIKKDGRKWFEIRPCCPKCRTLLPDMWFGDVVKSYLPIALIAGKGGGKTTYMTSLISENFRTLLGNMGISKWKVNTGITYEKDRLQIQSVRFDNLNKMVKEHVYPDPTYYAMPPVTISISRLDNANNIIGRMIVSIFDCKGELYPNLRNNAATADDLEFLTSMNSYIFLMEPKYMECIDYKNENISKKNDSMTNVSDSMIMSVKDQGEFQKQNKGKSISAVQAARMNGICYNAETDEDNSGDEFNVYDVWCAIRDLLSEEYNELNHIAYTIVKSDELADYPEALKKVSGMSDLLEQKVNIDAFNEDNFEAVDIRVEKFFENVVFNETHRETYMELLKTMGGQDISKSWHCISVARPSEKGGQACDFRPVRIAEPFARCILTEMKQLNWL